MSRSFVEFCLSEGALRFGEFTLKSKRVSPYFFNFGEFNSGKSLSILGRFYAQKIVDDNIDFDVLFGPAYKGIPLVTSVAIALAEVHQRDVPFCFNRKVEKDHGEGGVLVGAELKGRVLMLDDVITAGTTFKATAELIQGQGAELAGVLTALDRQERGYEGDQSASQTLSAQYKLPFYSISNLSDIIEYVEQQPDMQEHLGKMLGYQKQYGTVELLD